MAVRPKKYLGQHFLRDQQYVKRICESIDFTRDRIIIEIGPGEGVLTRELVAMTPELWLIETDAESVAHLQKTLTPGEFRLFHEDFLKWQLPETDKQLTIVGNLPYNISSQIFFKLLDWHHQVDEIVVMVQKEVAARIASPPGNRVYGILSVLMQTWYDIELLFDVPPGAFFPPPKVTSSVMRFSRNNRQSLPVSQKLLKTVVKNAFGNRRKTLKNALRMFDQQAISDEILQLRAEALSVDDFIELAKKIKV